MRLKLAGNIASTFSGFARLINLHDQIKTCRDYVCEIDMSECSWFDANHCAILGAILYLFSGSINLIGVKPELRGVLQKNGFFKNFGFDIDAVLDEYRTTIEYQRFDPHDSQSFKEYVARHFRGKGIPEMTDALMKKFRESLAEIFENAVEHSETQRGIFACGQYFPRNQRLDFSIADLGIGIKENIRKKLGHEMKSEDAIAWAMEGENTTKRPQGGKPGGLGLKLIKDFIRLNGGKIQIISDSGYWSYRQHTATLYQFHGSFPGTVVNIEINTADKQSYCLASEINPEEIF